jgi:hypothetical protein
VTTIRAAIPPIVEPIGTSQLRVAVPTTVTRERAARVLGVERGTWLGELVAAGPRGGDLSRYLVDLELRVSESAPRVAFRKAAYVDVGLLVNLGGPLALPISWRAAGLAPLFPVFSGHLSWTDGELVVDGHYAPPGGGIGAVADRLLLHVAARGTARRLLERIAEVLAAD